MFIFSQNIKSLHIAHSKVEHKQPQKEQLLKKGTNEGVKERGGKSTNPNQQDLLQLLTCCS